MYIYFQCQKLIKENRIEIIIKYYLKYFNSPTYKNMDSEPTDKNQQKV